MDYEDVGANSWITSDSFLEVEKITEVKNDGKTKDGI
jgi:pyruvate ferredoxin oxidoreductase gamma subunit